MAAMWKKSLTGMQWPCHVDGVGASWAPKSGRSLRLDLKRRDRPDLGAQLVPGPTGRFHIHLAQPTSTSSTHLSPPPEPHPPSPSPFSHTPVSPPTLLHPLDGHQKATHVVAATFCGGDDLCGRPHARARPRPQTSTTALRAREPAQRRPRLTLLHPFDGPQ